MTQTARIAAIALLLGAPVLHAQNNWITPTPAELSMTSLPEVPGASAVYLNREEIDNDLLHVKIIYERIKILTEAGKEYANVEIPYATGVKGDQMDNPTGRTIHADGTIVPFSGKPYQKLVEKGPDYKVVEKIFSLPSVEVGSIIEYRYKLRYEDDYVQSPQWYVQSELYTRQGHYIWYPTTREVTSELGGEHLTSRVAWTKILPVGATVKESKVVGNTHPGTKDENEEQLELTVHDIPPTPHEEYMPPLNSVSYRVLFYYTPFRTAEEYWKAAGKRWSRDQDRFIGPGPGVKDAVQKMLDPADTPSNKLRKFYAAVMELENTDFTRQHSTREDQAQGFREIKTTDDILARKRGSGDQLAELFIAMARAAGFKAYAMGVADRKRRLFVPAYLSTDQLDDIIAIVNVDGKDQFYDPGTRYCAFGHLAWRHTMAGGLRQVDGGTSLTQVTFEPSGASHVTRIADLTMDDFGKVKGTVTLSYTGDPALGWRHEALLGDEASLKKQLREEVEGMLPGGMDVKVTEIRHLTGYELPLSVSCEVTGTVGAPTGKRLLIPAALFEANRKPLFHEEKRELSVDMHYGSYAQDAVHIKLPPTLKVESIPATGDIQFPKNAAYKLTTEKNDDGYLIRRDIVVARPIFGPDSYPDLRAFYNKVQTKDQESVVLIRAAATPAGN